MRYTNFKLPEIAYVPGKTLRPTKEPLSSEKIVPENLTKLPPADNPFFLYGVDLFNHHYFWEAHEAWETIWHLEDNRGLRNLLQGAIQVSGGFLKVVQENEKGARILWKKAHGRLSRELLRETKVDIEPILTMLENDDIIQDLSIDKHFSPITLPRITPLL